MLVHWVSINYSISRQVVEVTSGEKTACLYKNTHELLFFYHLIKKTFPFSTLN